MASTTEDFADSGRHAEAEAILRGNDMGGYSVPSEGLYPFQWNWDSAFAALGYRVLDEDRAWAELETLLGAQWEDGMVPHVVFHKEDPRYFPGPDRWGVDRCPRTTGISQPPVLATAMRRLLELSSDRDKAALRVRAMLPKVATWHGWFLDARVDPETGCVAVIHPWEAGRDNSPEWDGPLSRIDTAGVEPYERRDLEHVDAAMRPKAADYDRYMALVQFGRDRGWDDRQLAAEAPFRVGDVGMTAILLRANRDLVALAEQLGLTDLASRAAGWIPTLERGMAALWNDRIGAYTALDLRSGERGGGVTSVSFLGFYAGVATGEQGRKLIDHLERFADRCRYLIPSYDPDHPAFDPRRYWCGPAWIVINRLVALGLAETGHDGWSDRIHSDSRALIENNGFYEYFDPVDGAGCGGPKFTWTAAMWLDWAAMAGK